MSHNRMSHNRMSHNSLHRILGQSTRRFGAVTLGSLMSLSTLAYSLPAKAETNLVQFEMYPVAQFVPCLSNHGQKPKVIVNVVRAGLNDLLTIQLQGFKPGIKFDMFSIENSPQLPNGAADSNFQKKFGLAWYQTDLEPGGTSLKTILLDQTFGLNDAIGMPPTKTFHMGFWFNDPKDAAACGFDASKPTPFNGEQKAGPLAFVTRQIAGRAAKLGPLCTKPNSQGKCDP